jgi:hypothetical protein
MQRAGLAGAAPSAGAGVDYQSWITRERRLRLRLLLQSPEIKSTGLFRVCSACQEVCLCHEERCPHCGGGDIRPQPVPRREVAEGRRIRCRRRYARLAQEGLPAAGQPG